MARNCCRFSFYNNFEFDEWNNLQNISGEISSRKVKIMTEKQHPACVPVK